ncbi:MAG: PEGA domain-containing protein [Myxococcales bacterium]|nr:PEGA domain-containing protein [Myxococcales bacterium]
MNKSLALLPLLLLVLLPTAATAQSAAKRAERANDSTIKRTRARVFIYLMPIVASGGAGDDLARVLGRLARGKLGALEAVGVKSASDLPRIAELINKRGDLSKLDRVSLIDIKNQTGIDGLVRVRYRYLDKRGERVELVLRYVDLRNGQIFRDRTIARAVDAELFAAVQRDLVALATKIRRSYRVTLKINANPAGARVYVDGKLVGRTPLTREIKAGEYTIRVVKKGYRRYEQRVSLVDGDTLALEAVLYNPLAARFLNRAPGLRVDSRQLTFGYRYVYLGLDGAGLEHAHLFSLTGLLRVGSFDVGLRFLASGATADKPIDSFVGQGEARQQADYKLLAFQGLTKYVLWEKYSFLSVRVGVAAGLTYASSDLGAGHQFTRWSFSAEGFGEVVARLLRSKNFALELSVTLGLAYLGQLPYSEREIDLFGAPAVNERTAHMIGPTGALSLRMSFFNDIF